MIYNYSNLFTFYSLVSVFNSANAQTVRSVIDDALREYEKLVLYELLESDCNSLNMERVAAQTGRTVEQTEQVLSRLLLKLRKTPQASSIWSLVDEEEIASFVDRKLGKLWNTEPESDLYYMRGGFCVNRNPYGKDWEAPEKGIRFDHRNKVMLMNMSDFHSTAIVLGQGDKRGLFVFEYAWGMQGFRYKSYDNEPFPYDEVRYCETTDDSGVHVGYFACRQGEQWDIIQVGDAEAPYHSHSCISCKEQTFEAAVESLKRKHCKQSDLDWKIA